MSTARKKGSRRGGGGRKRYSRKQKTVLHVTSLVAIGFVLWKMGILDNNFVSSVLAGNLTGAAGAVTNALSANFASVNGAINTAIQAGALSVAIYLIRRAVKGGVPMGRRIGAIGA